MTSVFDDITLQDMWSTKQMREVFSYENKVQKWLDFEAALALEQAELGIIPKDAAIEISKKAKVDLLDIKFILDETAKTKHFLIPTIRALANICDNNHGQFVHFGMTTQDVLDSGLIMQLRDAMKLIKTDLRNIGITLYNISKEHKNTAMIGRTMALQALPITFGYKTAIWLSELDRHYDRIKELEKRLYVGSVVGAVGTKASLMQYADALEAGVNKRLNLATPNIAWQSARDRLYEFGYVLGGVNATFNKIAHEILLLAHNEFNELSEPFGKDQVGSSTMPHKRNPVITEECLAVSNTLKSSIASLNDITRHEHERDCSAYKMEFKILPEICLMLSSILANMKFVLDGLIVKKDNMLKNLNLLQGYILTERVMFAVADKLGKQNAHELIHHIAMEGLENNKSFKEMLLNNAKICEILSKTQIEGLLDATTYVGLAPNIVEKLLADIDSRDFLKI